MNSEIIQITERAAQEIVAICNKETMLTTRGLRVSVVGGGCSGLSYKIDFSDKKEKDNIINVQGIDILIDPKSSIYLKDVVLDFKDGLNGKGFVFENPNAKNTCGCGDSFSV